MSPEPSDFSHSKDGRNYPASSLVRCLTPQYDIRLLRTRCFVYYIPLQKLIIDEKKYYLFGRNPDMCDFTIDHQSCSRVHSALVYHRHLKRVFLIDLNSSESTVKLTDRIKVSVRLVLLYLFYELC